MVSTSFWSADGKPISAEKSLANLYGTLPEFFKNEAELRSLWSNPVAPQSPAGKAGRCRLWANGASHLAGSGSSREQRLVRRIGIHLLRNKANLARIPRSFRPLASLAPLNKRQQEFLDFVLSKYIESGVDELDDEKLPNLLELKYQSISDATEVLGEVKGIRATFVEFQKHLYAGN